MTLNEFKAWFEGYTEGLEAAPTKAQFERIKEKVKEITGTPITYPFYIDRYIEPYRHYWTGNSNNVLLSAAGETVAPFDSISAMYAAGKAEAAMN